MTTARRTARRPSAVGFARTAKRLTAWDDVMMDLTVNSGADSILLLANNVADPEKRGCTVIRVLVHLWLNPVTPGVVSGQQMVTTAMGLASDDAFVAGTTGLANPEDPQDFPVAGWMYRDRWLVLDETLGSGIVAPVEIMRDLRVSRKLDRASLYFHVNNAPAEGTAFNIRWRGIIRVLYKLP